MSIIVRPYMLSITHTEGCTKRNCGPACVRVTSGWEYDIRVKLPTGDLFVERRKSPLSSKSATLRHAENRANHAIRESVAPAPVVKKEVPTVAEFEEKFLSYSTTNNKPSTVYAKKWMLRVHLLPFFGSMRLDQIGPAEIEEYKANKLAEKQDRKSINNHLAALRKMLNLAQEWGVIDRVPKVRGFKVKHQFVASDEFLDFEETDRFLRAAAPEWRAFLATALKTGLRVGELLALKWEDVDLVASHLVVRRTLWHDQEGPPKGGQNRKVPLSPDALATLKGHRHLTGPYVFCEPDGARLTHSRVKDVVPATCRRAGLGKRLTTHGLRHSFASHLVMRGASLKAVQELLGHESIEMTLRYSHLTPDVRRDAVRLLDGPAGTEKSGDQRETR
jgi:integrase